MDNRSKKLWSFVHSLNLGKMDWCVFDHLSTDEEIDAERMLLQRGFLEEKVRGHPRGFIVVADGKIVNPTGRGSRNFTAERYAKQFADYLLGNGKHKYIYVRKRKSRN